MLQSCASTPVYRYTVYDHKHTVGPRAVQAHRIKTRCMIMVLELCKRTYINTRYMTMLQSCASTPVYRYTVYDYKHTVYNHKLTVYDHTHTVYDHKHTVYDHKLTVYDHKLTVYDHKLTVYDHKLTVYDHKFTVRP